MTKGYKLQKKSLKERFLLIIGIIFFLIYLAMGLTLIIWQSFSLAMEYKYRVALGIVLIVYAFLRFLRFFKAETEEE